MPCLGAPGGSLTAWSVGGRLDERDVAAYTGDVARGLAYLHGRALVHGDVKARNVVIGGTPAFMAPEASDMDNDLLAELHRIGYTDAVPEVPAWLSAETKDFLACCFKRDAGDRSTAAQLLAHPFAAGEAGVPLVPQEHAARRVLAFWDPDTDDEADEMSTVAAERIGALACAASALPAGLELRRRMDRPAGRPRADCATGDDGDDSKFLFSPSPGWRTPYQSCA
ncbi:hypothetical protein HU200_061745 [Digitaria exilis]|uniref:Protein kinase domain-containing protein n=1 Tax=Digitaria exilis TaxID=1010633 RepID=A0A835E0L8_9POAL|nr:hypothetical protein HU200_061745 [Digitaria exilis]